VGGRKIEVFFRDRAAVDAAADSKRIRTELDAQRARPEREGQDGAEEKRYEQDRR